MATGNRKRSATGKKSSSGRKTNSGHKRNTKKQQEREAEFTREVILWIVVAVSLLLFISNFGFGGTIGGTVSRFFFGLFGIISYRITGGDFFCRFEPGKPGGSRKISGGHFVCGIFMYVF